MRYTGNGSLDLIEQITNLVIESIEPQRMLDQLLSITIHLASAQRGAVFAFPENQDMQLLCSQGADQTMIQAARQIYRLIQEGNFSPSEILYCADLLTDSRFATRPAEIFGGIRSFACIPILTSKENVARIAGFLYVDSQSTPNLCSAKDLEILRKFSRLVERAIVEDQEIKSLIKSVPPALSQTPTGPAAADRLAFPDFLEQQRTEARIREYLLNTPMEQIEKEKLILLMDKARGNITRVSELMEMQRRTIYLKLKKYGIQRTRGKGRPSALETIRER